MNLVRNIFFFFILYVGLFSGVVWAEDDLPFPIETIKAALAERAISQGPESSLLTRSPWGPGMYRQTVDAVVLILLPGEVAGKVKVGSGVIVARTGVIITNWHVVKNYQLPAIIFRPQPPKTLNDWTEADIWRAKVLVTYPEKDLAFLKLEQSYTGSKIFPPFAVIQLENPDKLMVGQDVFAIGHPQELGWTYTESVISQIRPGFLWGMDGRKFRATVLQTQTDISFGSSGGPLINSEGKMVGIISTMMEGRAGFNLAISAHEIFEHLSHLQPKDTEQQEIKKSS